MNIQQPNRQTIQTKNTKTVKNEKQYKTITELLEEYYQKPITEILDNAETISEEYDFGKPAGREYW
ncbi:MAG: hypothetical protein FWD71_02210 [Oscillospiraceae bacterium]|nr:hypothetical protein [Oscillospiraceae bacterium]